SIPAPSIPREWFTPVERRVERLLGGASSWCISQAVAIAAAQGKREGRWLVPPPPARDEAERRCRRAPQCASRVRVRSLRLSLAAHAPRDLTHFLAHVAQHDLVPRRE